MYRKLGLILLFFVFIQNSNAQCVPDLNIGTSKYLHPDALPFAMANVPYSQVLTFRVPKDTFIVQNGFNIPVTVDSAMLLFIKGIPSGFGYQCNNTSCTWKGGSLGCALITGMCDSTKVGEYPITVKTITWFRAGSTPLSRGDSSNSYTFKILPYNGLFEVVPTVKLTVYPNPSRGEFVMELRDIQSSENVLQVFDATGKMVYYKIFEKPDRFLMRESIDLSLLPKGIYHVMLKADERIATNKVMVE
jgi:hypothetical protein